MEYVPGRADHDLLRPASSCRRATARAVHPGLRGCPARAPEGHHPPRPEAVERAGHVQDDKPVPKIIDFGIAKATTQPLTERTLFTEIGVLVGTPEYMSPEQAD